MQSLNSEIFNIINGYANQSALLSVLSVAVAKYAVFIVPLYLTWMFLKKDDYFKQQSLFAFYSGVLGLALNFIITVFYFHSRPFMVGEGRLLIKHAPETSFPSDHTTLLLSIGFYLLSEPKLRIHGILFSLLGILVGISRIYCGVHWPFDIAGSFLVAFLVNLVVVFIKQYLFKINERIILISKRILRG